MKDDKIYTITFGGNETQLQIEIAGQHDMASDHFWKMVKDEFTRYVTGVHPGTTEMAEAIEQAKNHLPPEAFAKLQEDLKELHYRPTTE